MGTGKAKLCFLQTATKILCLFSTLTGEDVIEITRSLRVYQLEGKRARKRGMGVLSCDATNREDQGHQYSFILSKSRVFGWPFFLSLLVQTHQPAHLKGALSIQVMKCGVSQQAPNLFLHGQHRASQGSQEVPGQAEQARTSAC